MTHRPSDGRLATLPLAPHAPLGHYYSNEEEHRVFLRRIFDETASEYERIERLLALGSGGWYRRRALLRAGLSTGQRVIDVGIGTGLVAREALRMIGPTGSLSGVDPSPGMLQQVHVPGLELIEGRAEALPQLSGSADFLSMGYALRHISDVAAAFGEFHRVLRPGGRLLILEITRPQSAFGTAALRLYMRSMIPLLARWMRHGKDNAQLWRYYWDTIEACISPQRVMQALRDAGFTEVRQHLELGIFSEYTATKNS